MPEPAGPSFHRTPVILIPGTTRSKLLDRRTEEVSWGVISNFLGPHHPEEIALPIDNPDLRENRDELVPDGLLDQITIVPKLVQMQLYTRFLNTMRNHGYIAGNIEAPKDGENLFIFHYDWRRTFDENALILAERIRNLKEFFGNPGQKFDVLAHSSSVFIARYYLLYGGRDIRGETDPRPDYAGARDINKLVLINPAHEGLMFSFEILNNGFKPLRGRGVREFRPEEIFTMPAFFGLLPRYDTHPFVDKDGGDPGLDLYDADNWIKFGWSVFNEKQQAVLKKGMQERFPETWEKEVEKENERRLAYLRRVLEWAQFIQKAVSERLHPLPSGLPVYIFATEWGPTPERVCINEREKSLDFGPRSTCNASLMSTGDNMVTSSSLRGHYAGKQPRYIFLKEQHRKIANNKKIHRHLIQILWDQEPAPA